MKKVKTEESPVIHGFKGFDKDMKCRGFQFEEGKEYETDRAKACGSGFHACEYPLDVFCYYKPGMSVYHIVEQSGRIDRNDGDSKVASTKIKIGAEIDIVGMVKAGVKFILDKVDFTNTPATNTGDRSAATNTGNRSAATVEGKESIACGLGIKNKAMGKLGCWIVLSEWKKLKDGWHIIDIQSAQIDGKKIKADTFYELVNGKFTECE